MTVAVILELPLKSPHWYAANYMQTVSAKDAKNRFGLLLDRSRSEPVVVEKHGRPVVIVVRVEDLRRLSLASANSAENAELH